jgi:hypothetical protein|tara:strand:+ start:125 stop:481 length:357 start_codon:yes stop_codon:yes gene_type:complete
LSSCSVTTESSALTEKLSCDIPEIECYRFNYSSLENFKKSYILHLSKWGKQVPENVLSSLTENKRLFISSLEEAEELILKNPNDIYVLGNFIENNLKPREWLFIGEQAFLRSWNTSLR